MSLLFSDEELAAMAARVRQYNTAKTPPTSPSSPPPPPPPPPASAPAGFKYRPRTFAQWEKRAHQDWKSNNTFRPPRVEPEPEDVGGEEEGDGETLKSKVGPNTPCSACGHPKDVHRQPHADHPPLLPSNDMPCESSSGCMCPQFAVDGQPYRPRIATSEWSLCASCGHWRGDHCTKKKPGLVQRLKPREVAFKMMEKADGTSYGCRHFDPANPNCQCDSTGCSATIDGISFCECEKFLNPWLTPKKRTVAKPRKKKSAGTGEMFPPETTTASVQPE